MPRLSGFSDNPLNSRDDVLQAATSLLQALAPYKSSCGARIKLSTATGTGFDEQSAQLEGYARPLWVVADLLAQQSTDSASATKWVDLGLDSWVHGLAAGVDPTSDTYWGPVGNHDQRMVEMEPIAYALLSAGSSFFTPCSTGSDSVAAQEHKDRVVAWLSSINHRVVPPSNWRWFRILVNLALAKSCGVPYHEVKPFIDADFEVLDSFYLGEGWSSDGLWSDDKRQADYYSGSFAMQYSQLMYVRFAHDLDPERVARYRVEAGEFAGTFWRYFDVNGAAIPFGRSLTYRFAFAAFWAAAIMADIELPSPLNDLGVVKGLLFRHLRWWTKQYDIFNTDGTLTIGYTYPNMYMSEDYNSPQSLYWCLKSFSVLGIPKNHLFWSCTESPHPLSVVDKPPRPPHSQAKELSDTKTMASPSLSPIGVVLPAVQITCSFAEHHYLLSAGQSTKKPHKAREAKYSKFAYSSAFALSVPTGPLLPQLAPDSTLSMSDDEGETWRVRWEPSSARVGKVSVSSNTPEIDTILDVPVLFSTWRPWKAVNCHIETVLVPTIGLWPGWHVRIHKLSWQANSRCASLQLVDAGFAISGQGAKGGVLPPMSPDLQANDTNASSAADEVAVEGVWEGSSACLILSKAGASGIAALSTDIKHTNAKDRKHSFRASILKPDANTNLMAQRSLIPTLHHHFDGPELTDQSIEGELTEVWFISGIFAVAASSGIDLKRIREMWRNPPTVNVKEYLDLFEKV